MARQGLNKVFFNLTWMADLLALWLAVTAAYFIRFSGWPIPLSHDVPSLHLYLRTYPVIGLVLLMCNQYTGMYQQRRGISGIDELSRITRAVTVAFLLITGFTYFYSRVTYSRIVVVYGWVLTIAAVTLLRSWLRRLQVTLRRRGVGVARLAVVGLTPGAASLAQQIKRRPGLGYRIIGFIAETAGSPRQWQQMPVLGTMTKLDKIIADHHLDEIIFALPAGAHAKMQALLINPKHQEVKFKILSDLFGLITNPATVDDIAGIPIFALKETPLAQMSARIQKRLFDLALTVPALVLLSPLLSVIALAVKLSSPGPVLYKQERISRGNKPFMVWKFRSMRQNAEKKTGPVWATKKDSRVTLVGGFLRKTSLDELPQLFNILKGEMSLVGPRPERPHFVEQFKDAIPHYLERHQVKAGLTGWAQVHGLRGNTPIEERTTYDLWYVENWSLILDLKIIIRTALEFLHHSDAY